MKLLSTDEHALAAAISDYESVGARVLQLADGTGEAHAYLLHFDAGGAIGRHEAGYGQLFVIMTGTGWVADDDGERTAVSPGDVVYFERGEHHVKGSDTGMTALMFQVRDLAQPTTA